MPSQLEVAQKIQSLTNIRKVTGAMNLIASLRLRKLTARQKALDAFEDGLAGWPPSTQRPASAKTLAVAFTSDRGLCGFHNHAVNKTIDRLALDAAGGPPLEVLCLGARGAAYARRHGYTVTGQSEIKGLTPASDKLNALADGVLTGVLEGRWGAVVLVYNRFVSTLRQVVQCQEILPWYGLDAVAPSATDAGPEKLTEEARGLVVRYRFAVALAHSLVSEQAARMTAMDNATKNANDLTSLAIKTRNRVRQAGITRELMEIISGKEAMKR